MKRIQFLLLVAVLCAQGVYAQTISFKDQNLKAALLEKGYDANKNGEIEVAEIDTVSSLDIAGRKMASLEDLALFKSLKSLNANNNRITNLDVFFDNQVIKSLYVADNRFGKKLTLKNLKNLMVLGAARNKLEEIDLTGTDNIESIYFMSNMFEKIDLKNLLRLSSIALSGNRNLKFINISFNKALKSLDLLDTGLSQLDVSNNPLLEILYVEPQVKLIKGTTHVRPAPIVRVTQ